jgi:synaptic vesicle membrane protein VAT-1
MKAIVMTRHGGPEAMQVGEESEREPGAGEVRVRVKAAGLNFADIMARLGYYPDAPRPPCVLGYEVAGLVEGVGAGVTAVAEGQRVLALTRFGGQAEVVCAPEPQVLPMPEGMSFEEGAALPVNYLTAYHALFRIASLRPSERVLIHMAAGGVGLAALQLCRTVPGVETFGTSSSAKHDFLRSEGLNHPIDYRTVDYAEEVRRLTGGKGVDVVLDPLGGGSWRQGYRLLRPAGRLVTYGFANLASGETRSTWRALRELARVPIFTPIGLMNDNRVVGGINLGHLWGEPEMISAELKALVELYGAGAIRPRVDRVFRFEEAMQAHRHMQARRNVGKVILTP